ncbi:threonine aldolase family protein [Bacillus sp. 2205SS5-2]|uniref:threonine aldolase family protein n=1 Tax=Bacillus sp. 2205SS5-2 TaxID=3109031 RepID=UPI0030044629
MNSLIEAYKETKYQISGHGKRNLDVLKKSIESIPSEQESDIYGSGKIIEDFEEKLAHHLGKESAVFFPSGTMAQQIALRIWCDEKGAAKVAYHPYCHMEIHEEEGLKELHNIEAVLLADKERLIDLEDVERMDSDVSCLLLELPQREMGGYLPDYEVLEAISSYCRENGIKLHLDGARLFEVVPHYGKSAAEICGLFDSVYVSFYKGIGGLAGAILAGGEEFISESKIWKRRHGGDLISLYPYIVSADYYFDQRIEKMERYYEDAKELAALFNSCTGVFTKPAIPVSNMFHVHFQASKEKLEELFMEIYEATGIGFTSYLLDVKEGEVFYEVSIGDLFGKIPKEEVALAIKILRERMSC